MVNSKTIDSSHSIVKIIFYKFYYAKNTPGVSPKMEALRCHY